MGNAWFRFYHEWDSDPKVQSMPEAMQRRLAMLFCVWAKGARLSEEERAFAWRISLNDLEETRLLFVGFGFCGEKWERSAYWDRPLRPSAALWAKIRRRIFLRDDFTCAYCRRRGIRLECDHVVPVSRGGTHEDINLVAACFKCNRSKSAKMLHEWEVA